MITAQGLIKLGFTSGIDFELQDDGDGVYIAEWNHADPQPTEAEIETAHNEWQSDYDAQEYARSRKGKYPDIGDQLDMIWHLIDSGGTLDKTSDFYTSIKAVKDAHPKS